MEPQELWLRGSRRQRYEAAYRGSLALVSARLHLVPVAAAVAFAGCSGEVITALTCGPGTTQKGTECVPADFGFGTGGTSGGNAVVGGAESNGLAGQGGVAGANRNGGSGGAVGGSPPAVGGQGGEEAGGYGGGGGGGGGAGVGGAGGTGGMGGVACVDPMIVGSGWYAIGPSSDVVALCDGTALVGDRVQNQLQRIDLETGSVTATWQLTSAPGRMLYDSDAGVVYAALEAASFLAKVNLATPIPTFIQVAKPVHSLALGNDGVVIASFTGPAGSDRGITFIDSNTDTVIKTHIGAYYELIAYDRGGQQLITGKYTGSPGKLTRYSVDETSYDLLELQTLTSGGNCRGLTTSFDGDHTAYTCGAGNWGYAITDYSTDDLTVSFGYWHTDAYPQAGAFSDDGSSFVASNGDDILIFDGTTHALLQTYQTDLYPGCLSYYGIDRTTVSRTGNVFLAVAACGDDSGRLFWIRK
jgi:hypothetical protein